jgi:hypothetical protein
MKWANVIGLLCLLCASVVIAEEPVVIQPGDKPVDVQQASKLQSPVPLMNSKQSANVENQLRWAVVIGRLKGTVTKEQRQATLQILESKDPAVKEAKIELLNHMAFGAMQDAEMKGGKPCYEGSIQEIFQWILGNLPEIMQFVMTLIGLFS